MLKTLSTDLKKNSAAAERKRSMECSYETAE